MQINMRKHVLLGSFACFLHRHQKWECKPANQYVNPSLGG